MAKCFVCKKLFKCHKEFLNHLKIHYISKLSYFTCIECQNKSFSCLENFRRHMKNVHFNNERLHTVSNPPTPIPQTNENITDDANKKAKKRILKAAQLITLLI